MVIKHKSCEIPSYGCSDERTSSLSRDGRTPDVIMVFLGINDWGCGVPPRPEYDTDKDNPAVFSVAYDLMLEKLRLNYPDAEIWCLTLPVSKCSAKEGFTFPYRYYGRHIEEFSGVIRESAGKHGCRLIDVYRPEKPHDTLEGFHPNNDGMITLAELVIELAEQK